MVPDPQRLANPDDIEQLAHGLTDGALHCRESRRHDWRPSTVTREKYGFRRVQICTDCGSSRWQELDSRGYIIGQGMSYAEGYLNPPGTGRVGQDGLATYRLEALTRALPKARKRAGK